MGNSWGSSRPENLQEADTLGSPGGGKLRVPWRALAENPAGDSVLWYEEGCSCLLQRLPPVNPSDDRLRESCCTKDVWSGRRSNSRASCPGPGIFSHFPSPRPLSSRLKSSCRYLREQAGQCDFVVAPKRELRSLISCRPGHSATCPDSGG